MWLIADAGVLMQVSTENKYLAANVGAAGEGDVAAENEHITAHGAVKKYVPSEHPHAVHGMSVHFGGTEEAAGTLHRLSRGDQNIPPKMANFWERLAKSGQRWHQDQSAKYQAPHACLSKGLPPFDHPLGLRRSDNAVSGKV